MLMESRGDHELRIVLLPATRRDAQATRSLLERAGHGCLVCDGARTVAAEVDAAAGVLLYTDSALQDPHIDDLLAALRRQPPWSDIPSIVLCRTGAHSPVATHILHSIPNVTVLERPTSSRTLVSTVRAALRDRERQYQMRDQFVALHDSEAALKSASSALEKSNRQKDEFLAMLGHELRNPLAPIRSASELLERTLSSDLQLAAPIQIVKRQASHLARLVDDLLDVSRITEGRIELRMQTCEIAPIVAQAIEIVEPMVRSRHQTLKVERSSDRLCVQGDDARLVQSIANVLSNASKYSDAGGQIRVSVEPQDSSAVITVCDDGIGISDELLPRIFDVFVQGDRSLDRSDGGLGIGLSLVKRLVDMHGGDVRAVSDGVGCGSSFEIRLPLVPSPAPPAEEAAGAPGCAKRILVVDDNTDAADSLARLLELDGHAIDTVYSAREAILRANRIRPDVVVLDIGLPDMNGYEVAARIRATHGATQLIALTGYGRPEDVRRAHAVGFNAHVVKPVDINVLTQLIEDFHSDAGMPA